MSLQAISNAEPKRRTAPAVGISAGVGAVTGMGMRYILPTKDELKSMDTFMSSAAINARGANRSMLKYGAIGALGASFLALMAKVFTPEHKKDNNTQYTKLGTLIDAPAYSCEVMWFDD